MAYWSASRSAPWPPFSSIGFTRSKSLGLGFMAASMCPPSLMTSAMSIPSLMVGMRKWVMLSRPPAMKTSPRPHWICITAMCTDIMAVVQARSMLRPTTWSGKPARNGMAVPGCACSPIISTAPRITPSTSSGATPLRRSTSCRTMTARSSERTARNAPRFGSAFPKGVRTYPTRTASRSSAMVAGRVAQERRYWQTPWKQTSPFGPQLVKSGRVPWVQTPLCCPGGPTTLQPSAVQALPSLHRVATPEVHAPFTHTSLAEHGFVLVGQGAPSWTLAVTQPLSRTQAEAVHGLVSLQSRGGPPTQGPRMHASPTVQRLPSSHAAPVGSGVCLQPRAGSQVSVVHEFLSSQLRGGPLTHWPLWHESPAVQRLLSLQPAPSGRGVPGFRQPCTVSQSIVHGLLSSQFGGSPGTQMWFWHFSMPSHLSPSLHSVSVVQLQRH